MTDSEKAELDINDEMIKTQVYSLFGAGFGTTGTILRYGFMVMALYPDVQKKVHEELDRVVGKNRNPELADKADLPYTLAVVTEVMRHLSMAALSLAHSTTCDTEFRGYSIPKGTPVMFNYDSINRGDDMFENADMFTPERFIKEDGSFDKSLASRVVAFGLGPRRCAGEDLGWMQVFLFFATLLQQCRIEESPEHPLDLEDYMWTFGKVHNPFMVIFHKRIEETQ